MSAHPHAFVLLAAGSGNRMRGALDDKVLTPVAGRAPVLRCLDSVEASALAGEVFIVVRDEAQRLRLAHALQGHPAAGRISWVQGGRERQDSVRHALARIPAATTLVFIHDCARPLLSASLLRGLEAQALLCGSAVAARRVTDTLKETPSASASGPVALRSVDRSRLWAMETPQVFRAADVIAAYDRVAREERTITDDASALEAAGQAVALFENPEPNPKLTTPADIPLIEYLLTRNAAPSPSMRIGHGYDIHRLVEGRKLVLGGVEIPSPRGLDGHSDADALTHAICDSLLGALALPDIGHHFPNTDPRWKGVDSQVLLREVVRLIGERGYRVVNVDASLIAEAPKIGPHIARMRSALAASLQVAEDAVGIKATTNEKTGSLGRAEAIAAHAVCLLERHT